METSVLDFLKEYWLWLATGGVGLVVLIFIAVPGVQKGEVAVKAIFEWLRKKTEKK